MLAQGPFRYLTSTLTATVLFAGCTPFAATDGVATPPPATDAGSADASVPPAEPLSALSPHHPSGALSLGLAADWTIATLAPDVLIHYTTDGTPPSATSPSAVGKITLPELDDGTVIHWSTELSAPLHAFTVHVDPGLAASKGQGVVDRVTFDLSGTPIVKVAPNTLVKGKARSRLWNAKGCPDCIDQITIGIAKAEACLADRLPVVYPSVTSLDGDFQIVAPSSPGTYSVRTGFTAKYRCDDALGTALESTEVGLVVVE